MFGDLPLGCRKPLNFGFQPKSDTDNFPRTKEGPFLKRNLQWKNNYQALNLPTFLGVPSTNIPHTYIPHTIPPWRHFWNMKNVPVSICLNKIWGFRHIPLHSFAWGFTLLQRAQKLTVQECICPAPPPKKKISNSWYVLIVKKYSCIVHTEIYWKRLTLEYCPIALSLWRFITIPTL